MGDDLFMSINTRPVKEVIVVCIIACFITNISAHLVINLKDDYLWLQSLLSYSSATALSILGRVKAATAPFSRLRAIAVLLLQLIPFLFF